MIKKQQQHDYIQRFHVVPKALYFTSSLFINALHNYKAQFLVEKQRVPIEKIGLVYAVVGINFVGSIFWTRLADRFSLHRTISFVAPIFYGMCAFLFLVDLPPEWPKAPYATAVMGLSYFFSSAIFPLLDAIVFAMLRRQSKSRVATTDRNDGDRALFGRQRLFGTLAISVASSISYAIMRQKTDSRYTLLFVNMFASVLCYSTTVYFGVPSDLVVGGKEKDEKMIGESDKVVGKPSLVAVIRHTSPALPILLVFVLSSGYLRAIMNIYQNYMVDDLLKSGRKGPWVLGLVRPISEASIFFFSKPAMELMGVGGCLVVSQIAGIARVLGYGLMPKNKQSLLFIAAPLELLKGVSTGLVISAATRMGNQLALPGSHGTVHGLLAGTYTGLAMAIGGCFSSYLMSTVTPPPPDSDPDTVIFAKLQSMFLMSAYGSAIILVLFVIGFRLLVRLNSNNFVVN